MRPKLRKYQLRPEKAAALIAKLMPMGEGEMPATVIGWRDSKYRIRRIRADYPNGWRVNLSFSADGANTARSASFRMVLRADGRGDA